MVPFAMGTGMGYYSVYNLTVLSAEKGTFQDWQPTLNKVLSSLNYTPEFQSFAMSQSNQAASTSQSLSQSASEMSDSIMSSWENRNRSQDIMSQKQSDATWVTSASWTLKLEIFTKLTTVSPTGMTAPVTSPSLMISIRIRWKQ